jgi:hypothetical protein
MDASTTIPASTMSVIIAHFARHAGPALGSAILMPVGFLLCELVIRENPVACSSASCLICSGIGPVS